MDIPQEEKAALLERAVINSSVEELSKVYDKLGIVEMSAPALGMACRFRGLDVVKVLVEKGAAFDFPSTRKIEETYNCYIGQHYGNYRTNYSMYLLKAFGEDLKIFCLKGMTMEQCAKTEDGEPLSFLSDMERVDVLKFLLENREKIAFHPEELLYYAIYFQDTALVKELKKQDVKISDIRINIITEGANAMNGYWLEYTLLTERLADEAYLDVMQQLASEFCGKLFHYTGNILEITRKRFRDVNVFEFFLAHFKQDKMNKSEIIRSLIDENILDVLSIVEREGWLNMPRRRDEMIAYATERNRTEILAWLLDFKNRTADFAAEQEKAEKKMMRALNSKVSPNTVAALKKIWSYRKQEDGTLIITNYKGTDIKVTVPEKIGKFNVTAVGDGAFAGAYSGYNVMAAFEHLKQHSEITTLILPKTLQSIGRAAFKCMFALKEINIPESVKEIGENAFEKCGSLKSVTIPQGVKIISANTFEKCCLLQNIAIPKGVKEIGMYAFGECSSLKNITIPKTVEKIGGCAWVRCINLEKVNLCEGVKIIDEYAFYKCSSLQNITIPKTAEQVGTYAFAGCHKLEAVCICEGVKEIDAHAFWECSSLKSIQIPETVEEIGKCAFAGCKKLEQVCICGEVKKIGTDVFRDCSNLKEIIIQKSIPNRILGETFEHCPKLVVHCPKGSKTETYCKKKGIKYNLDNMEVQDEH